MPAFKDMTQEEKVQHISSGYGFSGVGIEAGKEGYSIYHVEDATTSQKIRSSLALLNPDATIKEIKTDKFVVFFASSPNLPVSTIGP